MQPKAAELTSNDDYTQYARIHGVTFTVRVSFLLRILEHDANSDLVGCVCYGGLGFRDKLTGKEKA